LTLALGPPAGAALGERAETVEADRVHLKGALRIASADRFAIHEIQTPEGGKVRELVSPGGVVFGVAWEGPRIPDLRQLLGSHFDAYTEAARTKRSRRGPLVLELPGLRFESYGHARAFGGRALVPELLPPGVDANEVR
jgi:hypothetical protein